MGNPNTVLDVGCGTGDFMKKLANKKKWKITGIDIHKKSLEEAKKARVYKQLIRGDENKVLQKLIKKRITFDTVFCSQLIEHLPKAEGNKLLRQMEKVANNRIIVCTPNGYLEQPYEHELHRNKHQVHKSGWLTNEFKKRGYAVRGVGLSFVWGEHGLARSDKVIISSVAQIFSSLAAPFNYFFPEISSGLISVKKLKK